MRLQGSGGTSASWGQRGPEPAMIIRTRAEAMLTQGVLRLPCINLITRRQHDSLRNRLDLSMHQNLEDCVTVRAAVCALCMRRAACLCMPWTLARLTHRQCATVAIYPTSVRGHARRIRPLIGLGHRDAQLRTVLSQPVLPIRGPPPDRPGDLQVKSRVWVRVAVRSRASVGYFRARASVEDELIHSASRYAAKPGHCCTPARPHARNPPSRAALECQSSA